MWQGALCLHFQLRDLWVFSHRKPARKNHGIQKPSGNASQTCSNPGHRASSTSTGFWIHLNPTRGREVCHQEWFIWDLSCPDSGGWYSGREVDEIALGSMCKVQSWEAALALPPPSSVSVAASLTLIASRLLLCVWEMGIIAPKLISAKLADLHRSSREIQRITWEPLDRFLLYLFRQWNCMSQGSIRKQSNQAHSNRNNWEDFNRQRWGQAKGNQEG